MHMAELRALIVDDEPLAREKLRSLLAHETDIEVVGECANGSEALGMTDDEHPDLIFLDIQMPELDGLGALKEIKALDPGAKIAMVTAMGQQSIVMEALKAGATDFVVKPFETERLIETVNKMIA